MKRLVARFDIKLPFFLLIKRAQDEELLYKAQIDSFDVEIFLKPYEHGPKWQSGDDEHWSFCISGMQIRVSRQKSIDVPPTIITKEGNIDYTLRVPYFTERIPQYKEVAVKAVNRVIRFFKYRLRNPLLHEFSSDDQCFQNPDWTDEAGQEIRPGIFHFVLEGVPGLGLPEFGIRKFTHAEDSELQEALQNDIKTELHEELLSDAQAAVFQHNLRRGILEMAIACEVAIKQAFFSKSTPAGLTYEYLEDKGRININITELIDGVAKQVFGESFKDVNKTAYLNIDHLFRCRNKAAHRGGVIYRDDAGILHTVDFNTMREWWESVRALFRWLDTHRY